MTTRITRLTVSALSLVAVALFLGVLTGRAELFLVGVPLLATLLWTTAGTRSPECVVTHEISADRLLEGDRLTVTVTLTARSRIPMIEILEPLPAMVELAAGQNRAAFGLRSGQRVRWSYDLRCAGRGRFTLGTVYVRVWERFGYRVHESRHVDPKPICVYPRMVPLRHLPRPCRTQVSMGNYVSTTFGEGLEPGEIRRFAPGDRIRHVNWRTSLRLGRLYVTQYHQERNADVVVMLDTLSRVGVLPETSLDLCVRAAAALATAYLARKDRVGLIEYGGALRWVKPGVGRAQHERLLDSFLSTDSMFSYVAKDLASVPPRILPPQALVIALSPLLDPRFVQAVGDLTARGFDVVLLAVSPVDLTRSSLALTPLDDLACRLWDLERQAQLSDLRRQGLMVLEWRPNQPLELALAPFARRRQRRALVG